MLSPLCLALPPAPGRVPGPQSGPPRFRSPLGPQVTSSKPLGASRPPLAPCKVESPPFPLCLDKGHWVGSLREPRQPWLRAALLLVESCLFRTGFSLGPQTQLKRPLSCSGQPPGVVERGCGAKQDQRGLKPAEPPTHCDLKQPLGSATHRATVQAGCPRLAGRAHPIFPSTSHPGPEACFKQARKFPWRSSQGPRGPAG